jgi:hypothetical protein
MSPKEAEKHISSFIIFQVLRKKEEDRDGFPETGHTYR